MNRRKLLKTFGINLLVAILGSVFWFKKKKSVNPYYAGPVTDHFDGRVFFNPNGISHSNFLNVMKWQMFEEKSKWPETYDSVHTDTVPAKAVNGTAVEVTLIGHATFLIQLNGQNLLTDPVFSQRVSPVSFAGPKRVNPPGVRIEDLPEIDVILLSHNHYDHLDLLTLSKLVKRDNPVIITPLGNDTIIKNAIPVANTQVGDWGDHVQIGNNTKIHFEPCHHWSARGMTDRSMALWAAFVIETTDRKIYHIGDTGFHSGINYKAAADKHGRFDLAILPIGAYAPRWFMKAQHQNPSEAVKGFELCKADYALGHHWGTFQLTNEPIGEPKDGLAKALDQKGVENHRFIAMTPGQVWRI